MLHISRPHPTPTQNLIETTRSLAFRSQAVQYAMQRKAQGEGSNNAHTDGFKGKGDKRSGGGQGGAKQGGNRTQVAQEA